LHFGLNYLAAVSRYFLNALLLNTGTVATINYIHIISDYGPRNVSSGYSFHKGIDYSLANSQKGYDLESGQFIEFKILLKKLEYCQYNYQSMGVICI